MNITGEKIVEIVKLSNGWIVKSTITKTLMETMTQPLTRVYNPQSDVVIFFDTKEKLNEWLSLNL